MENRRRNGRRARGRSYANQRMQSNQHDFMPPPQECKPWCLLSGLYSFLIMSSLIAIIYLMLDFHCNSCSTRYDAKNLTTSLENIALNLSVLRSSNYDLEIRIAKLVKDLPKLKSQMETLEALTNTLKRKDFEWHPKTHLTLPNVDVYLNKAMGDQGKNCTKIKYTKCSKHLAALDAV